MESKYRGSTTYMRVLQDLVRAAEYSGLTTYQHIAAIMGLPMSGNLLGNEAGQMLNEISEDEVGAGRPMLSAVAVGVSGRPGDGFFVLARELGKLQSNEDEHAFWQRERQAAYEAWRRPLPKQ